MKKFNYFLMIMILIIAWSCSSKCDCSLIYKDKDTGKLWYNRETNKPYTGICTLLYGDGKIQMENKYKEGKKVYSKSLTQKGELWDEALYDLAGQLSSIKQFFVTDESIDGQRAEILYNNGFLVSQKFWYPDKQHTTKSDILFIENTSDATNFKYLDNIEGSDLFHPSNCKPGSKVYYDNGQVLQEIPKPIQFTDNQGKKCTIVIIHYLKEGYIDKFGYREENRNNDGYSTAYVTVSDFKGGYTTRTSLSLEDAKDINKVIKSLENQNSGSGTEESPQAD